MSRKKCALARAPLLKIRANIVIECRRRLESHLVLVSNFVLLCIMFTMCVCVCVWLLVYCVGDGTMFHSEIITSFSANNSTELSTATEQEKKIEIFLRIFITK